MRLTPGAEDLLLRASRTMALSARGIARTLGVATTIARLAGEEETGHLHVSEALQFRVPVEGGATVEADAGPGERARGA